jgi:DNA-binding NarL/FixJ family response regulator
MPAKIQVLIIDDHAIVREGLKFILHATPDMEVAAEASSVPEALALLKAQHFDVILLDLSLPRASGMDLLRTVKAKTPTLPVLVVSAYAEDQYAVQVLKDGGGGFANKN